MRTWAEIDLDAIRQNARSIRRAIGDAELTAVVKANAYGHGVREVAAALDGLVDRFAVATLEEALALDGLGLSKPVFVLFPLVPDEVHGAVASEAELTLGSIEEARRLAEAGREQARCVPVHVKVNTGMNRYGVEPEEAPDLIRFCRESEALRLVGLWTHFAVAEDPDDLFTLDQYARFMGIVDQVGRGDTLLHVANSGAVLNYGHLTLDAVRVGLALYGAYPSAKTARSIALEPALVWRAQVSRVATLRAGESVSYGRTFVADHEMRIASIPVGHADGVLRAASNRGEVLIRGKRARILGVVCMDTFVCDVSGIPDVRYGDMATLIGRDDDDEITAQAFAERCGTTVYEVLTAIGNRVERVYRHREEGR